MEPPINAPSASIPKGHSVYEKLRLEPSLLVRPAGDEHHHHHHHHHKKKAEVAEAAASEVGQEVAPNGAEQPSDDQLPPYELRPPYVPPAHYTQWSPTIILGSDDTLLAGNLGIQLAAKLGIQEDRNHLIKFEKPDPDQISAVVTDPTVPPPDDPPEPTIISRRGTDKDFEKLNDKLVRTPLPPMPVPPKQGTFARLFAHDHSKGRQAQGVLAVEGVDENLHWIQNLASGIHSMASNLTHGAQSALANFKDLGVSSVAAINNGALAVAAVILPVGIYTAWISRHEWDHAREAKYVASEQMEQFEREAQKFDKFLNNPRDADITDQTTRRTLEAVSPAYTGLLAHLEHEHGQANKKIGFWKSSFGSGTAATANSGVVIGTVAAKGTAAALVGGGGAFFLPAVSGFFTTLLGRNHTQAAAADREQLLAAAPPMIETMDRLEKANPSLARLKYFFNEKVTQRNKSGKRYVRHGKLFWKAAATGTVGAIIGAGCGLAGGPAAPVTVPVFAAIGGVAGLLAGATAVELPIRHVKSGRHDRCAHLDPANPEKVQEAVFQAALDIINPDANVFLRAKVLDETNVKYNNTKKMLDCMTAHSRKTYKPHKHQSDIPVSDIPSSAPAEEATASEAKIQKKLQEKDMRRYVQDPENFRDICTYMRDQILIETNGDSSLREKDEQLQNIFGNMPGTNKLLNLLRPNFHEYIRHTGERIIKAECLRAGLDELLVETQHKLIPEDWRCKAMRVYLLHQGIEPHNVYDGMAAYFDDFKERDKETREAEVLQPLFRSGLMMRRAESSSVPLRDEDERSKAEEALKKAEKANQKVSTRLKRLFASQRSRREKIDRVVSARDSRERKGDVSTASKRPSYWEWNEEGRRYEKWDSQKHGYIQCDALQCSRVESAVEGNANYYGLIDVRLTNKGEPVARLATFLALKKGSIDQDRRDGMDLAAESGIGVTIDRKGGIITLREHASLDPRREEAPSSVQPENMQRVLRGARPNSSELSSAEISDQRASTQRTG